MTASAVSTYPTSQDNPTAPNQYDYLDDLNVEHDLLHDWVQDAIKKIEARVGYGPGGLSADVTSVDYIMRHHTHQGTDNSAVPLVLKARSSAGGTSVDVSDSTNSSLRVKHPTSGKLRFDADAGNVMAWSFADAEKMSLTAAGGLSAVGTDHYFGSYAFGLGTSVSRLRVHTDSASAQFIAEGDGADRHLYLIPKGGGTVRVNNGTSDVFAVSNAGIVQAINADHYFGPYAFASGTNVSRLHLSFDTGAVYLSAEGDGADRSMIYSTKGIGGHQWYAGANNIASLSAALFRAVAPDSYFGSYAFTTGTGVSRLRINSNATQMILAAEGDTTARDLVFRKSGAGQFYFQDQAGVTEVAISGGNITAKGSDLLIGVAALGAVGTRLRLTASGTTNTTIAAEGDATSANVQITYNTKGVGSHIWQVGATTEMTLDSNGSIMARGNTHGFGRGVFGTGVYWNFFEDTTNLFMAAQSNTTNVSLVIRPKGTGTILLQNGAGTINYMNIQTADSGITSGLTAITTLRFHNGTAITQGAVTVGAADSGGVGFRVLRVPNS